MNDEMPFELIAMTRPEGIARRIIPDVAHQVMVTPRPPLWLVAWRARGARHRLDRVRTG